MRDDDAQVSVYPLGLEDEYPHGLPTAVVRHRGVKIVLRFAKGDFAGEGQMQELCVRPDTKPVEARVLRLLSSKADLFVDYARSAMRIYGTREGTLKERWAAFYRKGKTLREVGGPGRGLDDDFYRMIAEHYKTLVDEGEPHPTKALGETHHVTISAASRWITEAKRRGYIEEAPR
jgi:hypothetical protein